MDGSKCNIRESDDQQQRDDGWRRPRKADSKTVSYLREVEEELKRIKKVDENQTHEQTTNDDGGDPTSMSLLIDNVLAEIRYSTASLVCDKDSSMVLEQILHAFAPNPNKAIALILSRCEPYFLCLATNRFASHVLQTLLDLSGPAIVREIDTSNKLACNFEVDRKGNERHNTAAESGTDEEHTPIVWETVLSLAGCAKGNWLALAKNFSGSHVGRALIRASTGCQMSRVNERRGCNRQYSSSSQRASVDGIIGKWGEPSSTFPRLSVPESFKSAISEVCEEIAEWCSVDLQKLTCCTSGGPFLITFLAACASSSSDVNGEQSSFCLSQDSPAMKVIESALEWEKGKNVSHDVVYGMAGEPVGSHFLEATIWLTPIAFLEKLHLRCLSGELREYCVDRNANFVVQAILRRLANEKECINSNNTGVKGEVAEQELHASPPSCKEDDPNIDNTSRAVQLAKAVLEELLWPTESSSFESEFLSSVPSGVLWAVAELAQRLLPDLQGSVRDAIGRISTGNRPSLLGSDQKGMSSSVNREAFAEARSWLPKLLAPCLLNDGGSESTDLSINGGIDGQHRSSSVIRRRSITVNVPGAQAIRSMLHFSRVNESAPVAGAISVLPQEVLVAAAKDSTAGRCVIDPVLALEDEKLGGREYRKVFRDAKLAIARAFKLKSFSAAPMDIKCNMADELCGKGGGGVKAGWTNGAERVKALSNTAPSGMTVVQKLQLDRYTKDKKGWKEAIMRHGKQAEAFELAFGKGSTTIGTKKLKNHSDNAVDVTTVIKVEKKAKRRHRNNNAGNEQNGSVAAANEGGGDGDDTDADRVVWKIAKRNKKEQTMEMERETALDQLLEGMGGRRSLLNDSDTRKMTTEGEIAAIWRKPGRTNSTTRHKRQAKIIHNEDSKGVVVKKQKEKFHNDKHKGNNNIDDAAADDVKGNTPSSVTKMHTKNKKKVIHDSIDFRLFK